MRMLFLLFIFTLSSVAEARTFYADPVSGSLNGDGSELAPFPSLEEIINNGMISSFQYTALPYDGTNTRISKNANGIIRGGDTVVLKEGLHGNADFAGYLNENFITLLGAPGEEPILRRFHIRAGEKWRLINVTVSSEPYGDYETQVCIWIETHAFQGPSKHIEIRNCLLYSTQDNTSWTATDWLEKSRSGIRSDGDGHIFTDNYLLNVDFGISFTGDSVLVARNTIEYFSGDGIRILGSHCKVMYNSIAGCIKVDGNHDDGMQSFTTGGRIVDSNLVEGNRIINHIDPTHPLRGPLQGIGCFDGPYHGWIVRNNLVHVDHYHAISFYGAFDTEITNNTAVDPSPDITPGPSWIRINPNKDGTPSERNLVANNVANRILGTGFLDTTNVELATLSAYQSAFENYDQADFYPSEGSMLHNTATEIYASPIDIDGNSRLADLHSDIGAFERPVNVSSVTGTIIKGNFRVWPNPTNGSFNLELQNQNDDSPLQLLDALGRTVWISSRNSSDQYQMPDLPAGRYLLRVGNEVQQLLIF